MIATLKLWLKHSNNPQAKALFNLCKSLRTLSFPVIPVFHHMLYHGFVFLKNALHFASQQFFYAPMFKSQVSGTKRNLSLDCGMPQILGKVDIVLGDNTRINGISTICGRLTQGNTPTLVIGNNVDIGWQNAFSVGRTIILEDNVRLAGKVFLAGFPGHPVDAELRAAGAPDLDEQVGDIVIKNGAWLGTGVTVIGNVTIGRGAIVGAGSVVTKDVPDNCIVAGNPAKVIRYI
jgi:acetyltransferase-like isoleucine patch superfamily enzyme